MTPKSLGEHESPQDARRVTARGRRPPEEMASWDDWAGPPEHAAISAEGCDLVRWATEVHREFYTDGWFARHAEKRRLPVMSSLYDWPLSSPIALVRMIERAARIALLPAEVRAALSNGVHGIRRSEDAELFDHLDVVLEVVGLALRDNWQVEADVLTRDGRRPDLRITRGTLSYAVEVTTQGIDREKRFRDHATLIVTQKCWSEPSWRVLHSRQDTHRTHQDAVSGGAQRPIAVSKGHAG